jgi:hypothetical protein
MFLRFNPDKGCGGTGPDATLIRVNLRLAGPFSQGSANGRNPGLEDDNGLNGYDKRAFQD